MIIINEIELGFYFVDLLYFRVLMANLCNFMVVSHKKYLSLF